MSEQSMIERVARAICAAGDSDPDDTYGCLRKPSWTLYTPEARAAIEAMREPTPEQLKAGLNAYDTSIDIWQAMIDAALKG